MTFYIVAGGGNILPLYDLMTYSIAMGADSNLYDLYNHMPYYAVHSGMKKSYTDYMPYYSVDDNRSKIF